MPDVLDVVGAVVRDGAGRIFLIRRSASRRLFPNCWDIPGGHVDPGETLEQAPAREIEEETGWVLRTVDADLDVHRWTGSDGHVRREHDYLVTVDGDLAAPRLEPDKHPESRWIGPGELDLLLEHREPGDDILRRVVHGAFARVL